MITKDWKNIINRKEAIYFIRKEKEGFRNQVFVNYIQKDKLWSVNTSVKAKIININSLVKTKQQALNFAIAYMRTH